MSCHLRFSSSDLRATAPLCPTGPPAGRGPPAEDRPSRAAAWLSTRIAGVGPAGQRIVATGVPPPPP
jgi:hypothetical protein